MDMVMERVEYYYRRDDGTLFRAIVDNNQHYFIVSYCKDYNALLAYLDTLGVWKEVDENEQKATCSSN